jgi:dipeptidyl aminopeptidase/acylaminoacyl peptidase
MKVSQRGALGAIALFLYASASQHAWSAPPAEAPLLPRALFFGAAEKSSPMISPDGHLLTYVAPTDAGSFNVWLTKTESPEAGAKPLTHATGKGIDGYRWAEDNTHILYWQDHEGDEKWHLYAVDIHTGNVKDLTPFPQAKIQNLITSPHRPHEVLVGLNKRDPMLFDMYRINLEDGSMQADAQNPGDVLSWTVDQDFVVRGATAFVPDTGMTVLRVLDTKDNTWRSVAGWQFEESPFAGQLNGGSLVPGFTKDGRSMYAISPTGADKTRLVKIDVTSGHEQPVAGSDCDVAEDTGYAGVPYDLRPMLMMSPLTGEPDAVAFECGERVWHPLDNAVRTDLQLLQKYLHRFPYIVSRDHADTLWILAAWAGDEPTRYSLFDRHAKILTPLFSARPQLQSQLLRKPESFQVAARDGLKVPVYLTRPAGSGPAPLILYLHGGPWARDHDDYDPTVQLLANRGYAVLQVEYRGSVGFGTRFFNAGNHEFGLKMRDDCIDAVEWAIQKGYADPKRVGVFGESVGGYLSLRVSEARPDLFRAVVDVAGPTDVGFLLASMPKNWQATKARWIRRIGDAEHDETLNRKLSPQFDTESVQTTFLIAQGANDPRVNMRHADSIVAKLRDKGASVDYVVYLDEGHGFARPESNLDFYGRVEAFLAKTLGGRAEPVAKGTGADVGADVEVR